MSASKPTDPLDVLGKAYETMYEQAVENLQHIQEDENAILHEIVDDAREQVVKLEQVSRKDAEKVARYLQRDLGEISQYLAETGRELKDWLGFETRLLESTFLDRLLEAGDKTTIALQNLKREAEDAAHHTGEVTGPGTLVCDECGEILHFYKTGRIPPCPKCHATGFHRKNV